jgi:hypothetical protein
VRVSDGTYRAKIGDGSQKLVFQNGTWTVCEKDGTRYLFGQTSTSRVSLSGGTAIWALDRIEDRNSNYLSVSYEATAGQAYPTEIDYGGNVTAGRSPDRRITFTRTNNYPSTTV